MKASRYLCFSASLLLSASLAFAQGGIGPILTQVAKAKLDSGTPSTTIARGYRLRKVVQGTWPLENPSGLITNFGFLSDGTFTEPDQNKYLVLDHNPGGPVPGMDYGRHFLIQGHENAGNLAYVTRVNLDVRGSAHKITLLTPEGADGLTGFNSIDGSAFNPFTTNLLFTQENGSAGGVIEVSSNWPPVVKTLDGVFGKGGFEGIHVDDLGNIYTIEDVGGTKVNIDPNDPNSPKTARQPNSFVYRLVPYNPADLSQGGKMQALQVSIDGQAVVFHADDPVGDTFSLEQLRLHTPGTSYPVQWVTIHDTAIDGFDSFDANALAKTALATPFKRPENMAFQPGANFLTFFFCPTGDTDSSAGNTIALAERGSWGSIFRVDLNSDRESGLISIFVLGDKIHSAFDNMTFANETQVLVTEDRGNDLHSQLNHLDSVWAYSVDGALPPLRFVALGRDATAVTQGEDNEPTGMHVSSGGPLPEDLPGTLEDLSNVRAFFTQQHGDNVLYEVVQTF